MAKVLPHRVIKRADGYVDGDIDTNAVEESHALLKRGMFGPFHGVSRRHLQHYGDAFCHRYHLRKADPFDVFAPTVHRGPGATR